MDHSTRETKIRALQLQMEGREAVAARKRPEPEVERPSNKSIEEQRADQLVQEIEERQDFMEQMTACGMGEEYETQIKTELAVRLNELKSLDSKIGR